MSEKTRKGGTAHPGKSREKAAGTQRSAKRVPERGITAGHGAGTPGMKAQGTKSQGTKSQGTRSAETQGTKTQAERQGAGTRSTTAGSTKAGTTKTGSTKARGTKAGKAAGGARTEGGGDALKRYRTKRRFEKTTEPRGGTESAQGPSEGRSDDGAARFVVQIHDASTMHFDFRLESEGVLKSWSVPKGPSPDPHEKRLAMPTEDHPLEYREFEGVIASGEYGAGTVIVWDEGTYRPLSENFPEALRRGHVRFRLEGTKLRGGYALTRFRGGGDGDGREAWLLVKQDDERAVRDGRTPDPQRARSARTSRTLKQVATEEGESEQG